MPGVSGPRAADYRVFVCLGGSTYLYPLRYKLMNKPVLVAVWVHGGRCIWDVSRLARSTSIAEGGGCAGFWSKVHGSTSLSLCDSERMCIIN